MLVMGLHGDGMAISPRVVGPSSVACVGPPIGIDKNPTRTYDGLPRLWLSDGLARFTIAIAPVSEGIRVAVA